jgi:phosphoglycolate phosphatase
MQTSATPSVIRGLLFDFDGTLADSFAAIAASTNHVRASYGLPAMSEAAIRKYVGHGLPQLLRELCPGFPTDEAVQKYREHHPSVMLSNTRLFPNVADTLRLLQSRGISMAVCSNKSVQFTKVLVNQLGLGEILHEVLGPEDAGGQPKPNPEMLLEACRRLGVAPKETVYIGDMIVDVQAGKAAGIPVWLVHIGQAGNEDPRTANPERILNHFTDLNDLIGEGPLAKPQHTKDQP